MGKEKRVSVVDRIRPHVRPQRNSWSCGPAALRHALLCYGVRVSIARLYKLTRVRYKQGVDTIDMQRAAASLGYELQSTRRATSASAQSALRSYLRDGHPVILCVDRDGEGPWRHWISAAHATERHVWICDSGRWVSDNGRRYPVLRRMTWREFLGRWCTWFPPDEKNFDLYPLLPATTPHT